MFNAKKCSVYEILAEPETAKEITDSLRKYNYSRLVRHNITDIMPDGTEVEKVRIEIHLEGHLMTNVFSDVESNYRGKVYIYNFNADKVIM